MQIRYADPGGPHQVPRAFSKHALGTSLLAEDFLAEGLRLGHLGTTILSWIVFTKQDIFELTLSVGSAGVLDPPFHRSVGLKAIE